MKYLFLLIIFSCNKQKANPEPKEKAEKPAEVVEQKPDKCAINMAKLAMLSQEVTSIDGKITLDDYDTDCPTDKQLQDMRHAIKVGKKKIADEKLKQAQERADRQERRFRAWLGRYDNPAVTFRMGAKCYLCEHGNIPLCKQEKLEEASCLVGVQPNIK